MEIDQSYLTKTLAALVGINSINPAFSRGTTNEAEIAGYVGAALTALGMQVRRHDAAPGRTSVVGRLPGTGAGRSLLLYAHMDTVGVDGMAEPFNARIDGRRMYGRGTYDMKGGLAACMAAAKAVVDRGSPLGGELLIAAVADEEVASIGMADVLRHHHADAAIVTESTELDVCLAHKGFCWIEIETDGRAAHGSRFEDGIDANMHMGRVLSELAGLERDLRARRAHPLVGPPSLHTPVIHGGTGTSTYAAHCRLEIERRTVPGETEAQVLTEIQSILDRLAAADPTFSARARGFLTRAAFEAPTEAPITRAVVAAARDVLGRTPGLVGKAYWMDAALLAAAGTDTVVIGPTGAGAHAIEEWVDLDSVAQVASILAQSAVRYLT